eukprot:maker-scaffold319_size207808-snap-gene-0.23 protein:Tk00369 transcript:maker-scaffold319_size207808-snap-gene-0.23-mRNA-1 annotation:"GL22501"
MLSPALHHGAHLGGGGPPMGHPMGGGHSLDLMGHMNHPSLMGTHHHGHTGPPAAHPMLMGAGGHTPGGTSLHPAGNGAHTPGGVGPALQVHNHSALVPTHHANQVSLSQLIEFIVQRSYHDLTVLAELLPRKTDMERKIEIFNFASRTRMILIRLLGLVKWASSASKVDKCASIMNFCERSAGIFMDTADALAKMSRETLVRATLPNFHLPAAVEILTTGSYSRVP